MSNSAMPNGWFAVARTSWRSLIILVLLAALASLVTTAWLANSRGSIFVGVVFGLAMTCGLAICRLLPNFLSAAAMVFASIVAYCFAYFASFGAQLAVADLGLSTDAENWNMGNSGSVSPIALFVGGLIGAFLLAAAFLFSVMQGDTGRNKLRRALVWSAIGGGLAILGWVLSPLLGPALSPLVRVIRPQEAWLGDPQFHTGEGPVGMVASVHFVWQVGMALAIGVAAQKRSSALHRKESR